MDWTPVEQAAVTAAASIISACAIYGANYIRSHIKDQALANALATAETTGAGIAYDALTTAVSKGAPDWSAAKTVAIAEGTAAAQKLIPDVTQVGVTAALAPLLAADATVAAGVVSVATAVVPVAPSVSTTPIATTLGVLALLLASLSLSACTTAQVGTALSDVRVFCATKDAVVGLTTATGTPVLAQGQSAAYVAAACALVGGVAVAPPASPGSAPVVTIPVVSVPL